MTTEDKIDVSKTKIPSLVDVGITPYNPSVQKEPPKPTLLETGVANFRQWNLPFRTGKRLVELDYSTIGLIEREEGYDPIAEGLLDGVPREFYMRILGQKTRKDALTAKANIEQELGDMETASRSGFVANMVTSLGATFLDPTMIIPLGQTLKYTDTAKTFIQGFKTSAVELGAFNALNNAASVATKETQDIKNWADQTLLDTFFAASIGGALHKFSKKGKGFEGDTDNAKTYFKAASDGNDIVVKLDEKGNPEGLVEAPGAMSGVGAAEVKDFDIVSNAGSTAFKDNKFVKHVFGLGSPVVKGATSSYKVMQELTTDLWGTNFRTSGGVARAIQDPGAYDFLRSWQGLAAGLRAETRSAYLNSIGVSGIGAETRASVGAIAGKYRSELDFNEAVGKAYKRGFSDDPDIDPLIGQYNKVLSKLWDEAKLANPSLKDHEFTIMKNHLMRIYNKEKIQAFPEDFENDAYRYLSGTNQRLAAYTQQYENLKEDIQNLRQQFRALKGLKGKESTQRRKGINSQIRNNQATLKQLTKKRQDDIRSGVITPDMLENRALISTDDARDINKINKPIEDYKKKLKELEKTNLKKATLEEKKAHKAQVKELKDLIKEQKQIIRDKIIHGEIAENLLYTDRFGKLHLKNPNKLPELRSIKTPAQLKNIAASTRDTIEQLNEEQMFGALFGTINGNTPATLKERSFLWNDEIAEPWVVNDITQLMDVYVNSLAKYLQGQKVFKKYGIDIEQGKTGIAKAFKEEYDVFKSKILEEAPSPERTKKLNKLKKELDSNIDLTDKFFKAYFGSLVDTSSTPYKVSNAIRQFTSSVLLTNTPILMLTEFITPTFKMGYKEFVHDGLIGTVSKMQKFNDSVRAKMGDKADTYLKGYYSDALVGCNRFMGQSLEAKFGYAEQYYQKTWYQRFTGATSKLSDTFSGASYIMDRQEVVMASMTESRLMRVIEKYSKGEKLLQEEVHFLDEVRVNPNKWAKRYMAQFEREVDGAKIGEHADGGYISNYHLWDDFEAAQSLRIALDRHVRSVVTKPGPADVPFVFKDPIGSLLFQFLSWPFAATQNFLLPALTEFDKQKLIGIVSMMAVGSMIDPLRQLAKGEEDIDLSFEALAASALANSGVMGWQYDQLSRFASYMNFAALRASDEDTPTNSAIRIMLPDRFKGKGISSLLGSPFLGTADMIGSVASSLFSNEFNQADALKATRVLAPWLYNYGTQSLFKKAWAATDLPATRREATEQ